VLCAEGDLAGVRLLYEHALAIYEKVLGAEHPNTNHARLNFARLFFADSKAPAALMWSEAALAARERALGENHPWTTGAARITAHVLDTLGRVKQAAGLRARYQIEQ
jgi:hypothetical protein